MSGDLPESSIPKIGVAIGFRRVFIPQLVVGAFVALAGIVLALDVMGIVDLRALLRLWPVVFIAIGLASLLQQGGSPVGGLIWLALGSYLLLMTLGILPNWTWRLLWPFVLIATGVALVAQTMRSQVSGPSAAGGAPGGSGGAGERIRMIGVLGGSNRTSSANFRGADLIAFMGGGRLDLRHGVLPPGEPAVIDVVAVMGGYEIIVPEGWAVDDRTVAVMGGNADETRPPSGVAPTLIVRGLVMMGGLGIKN